MIYAFKSPCSHVENVLFYETFKRKKKNTYCLMPQTAENFKTLSESVKEMLQNTTYHQGFYYVYLAMTKMGYISINIYIYNKLININLQYEYRIKVL